VIFSACVSWDKRKASKIYCFGNSALNIKTSTITDTVTETGSTININTPSGTTHLQIQHHQAQHHPQNSARMLFENPAVAAKLPFPYNVPPPLQAAAAAAAAVPNLR